MEDHAYHCIFIEYGCKHQSATDKQWTEHIIECEYQPIPKQVNWVINTLLSKPPTLHKIYNRRVLIGKIRRRVKNFPGAYMNKTPSPLNSRTTTLFQSGCVNCKGGQTQYVLKFTYIFFFKKKSFVY